MSIPPSTTINHIQVAEIEKNSMTLLKSLVKVLIRKLLKQKHYWILEQEGNLLIKISSEIRKSRQRTWNTPLKFLMWMEPQTNGELL